MVHGRVAKAHRRRTGLAGTDASDDHLVFAGVVVEVALPGIGFAVEIELGPPVQVVVTALLRVKGDTINLGELDTRLGSKLWHSDVLRDRALPSSVMLGAPSGRCWPRRLARR